MVEKLTKVESSMFQECYEGKHGSKIVVCILDDNCVRYVGYVNNKRVVRRVYDNNKKALCMARALAWLNK